jgi:tRNA pseudouridine55 synthase
MGRNKKGLPISGWLVIDKPLGMSSAQVVGKVRWLTKAAKVGHAGTLDPLATGVLPIALGEATKTVSYAMDKPKTYRFTVEWGRATTTDDAEGETLRLSDHRPGRDEIEAVLPRFTGEIRQVPPAFSAIKIDGQRAYAMARAGEEVELAERAITVHKLALVEQPDADHAIFEALVGKGCYVRSLARDIAIALGTEGHVTQLERTSVGKFDIAHAISLEMLSESAHGAALDAHLLAIETVLDDIPALALTEAEAGRLRQGQTLSWISRGDTERLSRLGSGFAGTALALLGKSPIALVEIAGIEIRPVRVLNL